MNRVELDPVLRDFGWEAERIGMMLSNRDRVHKMNRRERKIFRLEREVLNSKRWAKMKEKVELGVPGREDPALRVVKAVRQQQGRFLARAGPYLEVNEYGGQLSGGRLKRLVAHEMIHYYLHDNKAWEGDRKKSFYDNKQHGALFKECAAVLIDSSENPTVYRYSCPCGWWIEIPGKRKSSVPCHSCRKTLVTKTEYDRLRKVSAIGSRVHKVELSKYAVMAVKRKDKTRPSLGRKA